jgi:hypothetical protein
VCPQWTNPSPFFVTFDSRCFVGRTNVGFAGWFAATTVALTLIRSELQTHGADGGIGPHIANIDDNTQFLIANRFTCERSTGEPERIDFQRLNASS